MGLMLCLVSLVYFRGLFILYDVSIMNSFLNYLVLSCVCIMLGEYMHASVHVEVRERTTVRRPVFPFHHEFQGLNPAIKLA